MNALPEASTPQLAMCGPGVAHGVHRQQQRGAALPPAHHPVQQDRKAQGNLHLRVTWTRCLTAIFQPLPQALPWGVVGQECPLNQDGFQTGAFGLHRAVYPGRQDQRVGWM